MTGSLYIADCDGSGIVELLMRKVNELAATGTYYIVSVQRMF